MSAIKLPDVNKFRKQWVAFSENHKEIVGNGSTIQKAIEKANKNGIKKPILLYVSPILETCVV